MIKMEMWFLYSLIAMLAVGFLPLIHRVIVKKYDWVPYLFLVNTIAGIAFLAISGTFIIPGDMSVIGFSVISITLAMVGIYAGMESTKLIEASDKMPLKRLDIFFTMIFSVIFLSEIMTASKIIGGILIFFGTVVITYEKGKKFARLREYGTQLVILTAVISGVSFVLDKHLLMYWDANSYTIFNLLVPGLILGVWMLRKPMKKTKEFITQKWPLVALVAALYMLFFFGRFAALALTDVTNVLLILRLSTMVTVISGIILLNESSRIHRKILSAILMVLGAIMIAS